MIGMPRSELFAFQASIRVRRLHSSASVLLDGTNSKMFRFRKLELYGITVGNALSLTMWCPSEESWTKRQLIVDWKNEIFVLRNLNVRTPD